MTNLRFWAFLVGLNCWSTLRIYGVFLLFYSKKTHENKDKIDLLSRVHPFWIEDRNILLKNLESL